MQGVDCGDQSVQYWKILEVVEKVVEKVLEAEVLNAYILKGSFDQKQTCL